MIERCYHCGCDVSTNSEHYTVSKQYKKYHRWEKVGVACDSCIDKKSMPCRIRAWTYPRVKR